MGEAVAAAFGVGFNPVESFNAEEPAQDGAVGQQFAELAVGKVLDKAGDVSPQSHQASPAEEVGLTGRQL